MFGDNWSLRFCAVTSVAALFDFRGCEMIKKTGEISQTNNNTENISNKELFKRALIDGLAAKISKLEEEMKDTEIPPLIDQRNK